jgi:hypothetical protein
MESGMTASDLKTAPRSDSHLPPGTRYVALWLAADLVEASRAAFLCDFYADPANGPVTLVSWVTRAVDAHNSSTIAERAEHSYSRNTRGVYRTFYLPVATVEAMHQAIAAETKASGRFVAVSHYMAAAIHRSVQSTRRRVGGPLPAAPTRLPDLRPVARRHREAESCRQEVRLRRHLVQVQADAITKQLRSDEWVNLDSESLAELTARRKLLQRGEQTLAAVLRSLDVNPRPFPRRRKTVQQAGLPE